MADDQPDNDPDDGARGPKARSRHRRIGAGSFLLVTFFAAAQIALYLSPGNTVIHSLAQLAWAVTVPLAVGHLLMSPRRRTGYGRRPMGAVRQ